MNAIQMDAIKIFGSLEAYEDYRKKAFEVDLEGSEKQIKWAEDIIRRYKDFNHDAKEPTYLVVIRNFIQHHTEAKFYIEKRDRLADLIWREIEEFYEECDEDEAKEIELAKQYK